MALDKAISSGKEHRKQYYGAQAVDKSCRNGGSCPFCQGNRLYKFDKALALCNSKINEYVKEQYND